MLEGEKYVAGTYKVVVTATLEEETVTKESEEVKVVKEEIEAVDKLVEAINKANNQFQLKDALKEAGIEFDEADLPAIEDALKENKETLEDVEKAIKDLEKQDEFNALKEEIEKAKGNDAKLIAALEKASDEVKKENVKAYEEALFDNKDKLESEINSKEKIQEAIDDVNKAEADKAAFEAVKKMVEELPETLTLEDKSKVEAARKAYDALTEDQKELDNETKVDEKIKADEKAIAELEESEKAKEEAIKAAEEAMAKYEEVMGDEFDKEDVKYKAVVEALKTVDEAENLDTLTDATNALTNATEKATAVKEFKMEFVEEVEEVKAGETVKIKITAIKEEKEDAIKTVVDAKEASEEGITEEEKVQTLFNETVSQIVVSLNGETTTAENVKFTKGEAIIEVVFTKATEGEKEIKIEQIDGKAVSAKVENAMKLKIVAGELDKVTAEYNGNDGIEVKAVDKYKNDVVFEIKDGKLLVKEGDKASISGEGVANNGSVIVSKIEGNKIPVTLTEGKYTLTLNTGAHEFEIEVEAEKEEKPEA